MNAKGIRLVSFSSLLALAGSSFGGTIFNSFGPGDSYGSTGYLFGIDTNALRSVRSVGAQFTASGSGLFSSIEFGSFTFVDGLLKAELFSDANNEVGTVLESFTVTAVQRPLRGILRVQSANPLVPLVDGTKYWVVLSPADSNVRATLSLNSIGLTGRLYGSVVDSERNEVAYEDNRTMPAFRVNVVPEPASMAALGLGAFALLRKRRKSA